MLLAGVGRDEGVVGDAHWGSRWLVVHEAVLRTITWCICVAETAQPRQRRRAREFKVANGRFVGLVASSVCLSRFALSAVGCVVFAARASCVGRVGVRAEASQRIWYD